MSNQNIIDKIRKLQALATSPNVHEAASAAAMVQKLIERHKIEAHLLEDVAERESEESFLDRVLYTFKGPAVTTWILQLGNAVAAVNGVKLYYNDGMKSNPRAVPCTQCGSYIEDPCQDEEGFEVSTCHNARFKEAQIAGFGATCGSLSGVGTEEDLEITTAMLVFLTREIDRLYKEEKAKANAQREEDGLRKMSQGEGLRWGKSFRNGAVSTIRTRLRKAKQELHEEMKAKAFLEDAYQEARAKEDADITVQIDALWSRSERSDEEWLADFRAFQQALHQAWDDYEERKETRGQFALARVEKAIDSVEGRLERAKAHAEANHSFKKGGSRSAGSSLDGFIKGRKAGQRADLQGHKRKRIGG